MTEEAIICANKTLKRYRGRLLFVTFSFLAYVRAINCSVMYCNYKFFYELKLK